MRSANHSAPLQGLRPYKALLGLIQASGLAGGFDLREDIMIMRRGGRLCPPGGMHLRKRMHPGESVKRL